MNTSGLRGLRVSRWAAIIVLFAAGWLLPSTAAAQTYTFVTVNCDPAVSADYHKISQALNNFSWVGMLEIEVTGTCRERVYIGDGTFAYNSVYIHPPFDPPTARATVMPPAAVEGSGPVFQIGGAHGIYIERLDISNAKVGIDIYDSSEVDLFEVTIENNVNAGVRASGNSIVYFGSSRIRNNGIVGVDVGVQGASTAYFSGGGTFAPNPTIVEGNGQLGVNGGSQGAIWFQGYNIVRNNGGSTTQPIHGGIHAARTSSVTVTSNPNGATEITGNVGPGVVAEVNASVSVQGANIHANSEEGIRAKTLSVVELVGSNTFAGNGVASVSCDPWSVVTGDFTGVDLKTMNCKNVDLPAKK